MEENFRSKLGFIFFIVFVLVLAIGGFFFTKYILNSDNNSKNENTTITNYKIDSNKDYIYYIDDEILSEGAELNYKNVVINIKGQETLTESLKDENTRYKSNIQYISDQNLISSDIINYNYDNLYALTYRTYENYEYENYVSLVLNDFNYSCFDLLTFTSTRSYIFNTKNGNLLTENEILNKYSLNMDNIKEKIRTYLTDNQKQVEGVDLIKIDETINDLNNYAFYINNYGRLYITFLVKTTQVDYNGVMEVK